MKHLGAIDAAFQAAEKAVSQSRALVRSKQASPIVVGPGGMGDPSGARMAIDGRELLSHFRGWVYAAVRCIASRIAGLPIVVERRVSRPRGVKAADGAPDWEPVAADHPLALLFDDPCPIMPRWSLVFSLVANLELTGRGLLMIDEERGGLNLWNIPTSWATPQHELAQPFASWKLRPLNTAETQDVPGSEMIHVVYPNPADPLGAVAPLEAAGLSVLADERLQTAQYAAFENGINPGLALIVGDVARPGQPDTRPALQKSQRQQIITAMRQQYAGAWRNREPLILDALIRDVKKISLNPDEMDFLQSGQITKARILQTFGVSPAVLGELVDANRASSAAAEAHFSRSTIGPKVELLNRGLTEWLAPRFATKGETLRVRIAPPEVTDPDLLRSNVESLARIGAISRNEARSLLLGLPAMAGGDTPLVPIGLAPLEN